MAIWKLQIIDLTGGWAWAQTLNHSSLHAWSARWTKPGQNILQAYYTACLSPTDLGSLLGLTSWAHYPSQTTTVWLFNDNHRPINIIYPPCPNNDKCDSQGNSLAISKGCHLYRVLDSNVSDWDTKFMSIFWHELQWLMGMKLLMSTAFHPQMDGATEWANCMIRQILHSVVRDDQKDWVVKCPMVKVVLSSSISTMTVFAPFELNHGYMLKIDLPMATDTPFKGVSQFAQQACWNLMCTHDAIAKHHVTQHFKPIRNALKVRYMQLATTYTYQLKIWPYQKEGYFHEASTVTLKLPDDLKNWHITLIFHTSLIHKYEANNDDLFPHCKAKAFYNFGLNNKEEWLINEILSHQWINSKDLDPHVRK